MNEVRTYTAAPGRPIPPSAMNTIGSSSESSGMGVVPRIQRQVAAHRDVVVAESPGGERVPEFVQAQRHQPAGDHEDEHPGVGQRLHARPGQPGQHTADGRQCRRWPRRSGWAAPTACMPSDVHSSKLPDQQPAFACAGRTSTGAPGAARRRRRAPPRRRCCPAGRRGRSPSDARLACDRQRARRPGMASVGSMRTPVDLAVEQRGVVDDGLAVDRARRRRAAASRPGPRSPSRSRRGSG